MHAAGGGVTGDQAAVFTTAENPMLFKTNSRTDCSEAAGGPSMCVSETNYKQQADALVDGGFRAAGYKTISIDE